MRRFSRMLDAQRVRPRQAQPGGPLDAVQRQVEHPLAGEDRRALPPALGVAGDRLPLSARLLAQALGLVQGALERPPLLVEHVVRAVRDVQAPPEPEATGASSRAPKPHDRLHVVRIDQRLADHGQLAPRQARGNLPGACQRLLERPRLGAPLGEEVAPECLAEREVAPVARRQSRLADDVDEVGDLRGARGERVQLRGQLRGGRRVCDPGRRRGASAATARRAGRTADRRRRRAVRARGRSGPR